MASTDLLKLTPQSVWKHFYSFTRIPRPTGKMEEITRFVKDFGEKLNLETGKTKWATF